MNPVDQRLYVSQLKSNTENGIKTEDPDDDNDGDDDDEDEESESDDDIFKLDMVSI